MKVDVYFYTSTYFLGTDYSDFTDKVDVNHTLKTVLIRVIRA